MIGTGVTWPVFKSGDRPHNWNARALNFLVDQVRRLCNISVGPGLELMHTRTGLHLNMRPQTIPRTAAATITSASFMYAAVGQWTDADTLTVYPRLPDGTNGSATTAAKPYHLRGTPFSSGTHGGYTYTYYSDYQRRESINVADDTHEFQEVTPSYYLGCIVLIAQMPTLLESVAWQDITPRQWAKYA